MTLSFDNFIKVEDFLKKIGNLGSGSVSNIFEKIFKKKILIDIKNVKLNKEKIKDKLSHYHSNDFFMISKVSGLINGVIIFNSCKKNFVHKDQEFFKSVDLDNCCQEEIFYEIFNIGIAHYLSSISNLINEKISVTDIEFNQSDSRLLKSVFDSIEEYTCIDTSIIYSENNEIIGSYLFIISKESLEDVLDKFKSYKILICDDTSFMRVIAKEIIQEDYPHMIIEEAKHGKEALDKYIELKPDLVIMDLIMPGCDGIQATEEILKYDPNAKIIIASATVVAMEVIKALKAGAKDFIAKPYTNQRVLSTVKRFLLKRKIRA